MSQSRHVLVTLLAVATAGVMYLLLQIFATPSSSPTPMAPATSGAASLVYRFYDEFNHALATGDANGLILMLATDFVDHSALTTGTDGNQVAFARELALLHGLRPGLRLSPIAIDIDDDRVIVFVNEREEGETVASTETPMAASLAADRVEALRIADGTIAERWAVRDGAAYWQPIPPTSTPLAPVSVYLTVVAALQTMPGQYLPQLATATIGPGPAATMPGAPP
jgi:hypothetical protein